MVTQYTTRPRRAPIVGLVPRCRCARPGSHRGRLSAGKLRVQPIATSMAARTSTTTARNEPTVGARRGELCIASPWCGCYTAFAISFTLTRASPLTLAGFTKPHSLFDCALKSVPAAKSTSDTDFRGKPGGWTGPSDEGARRSRNSASTFPGNRWVGTRSLCADAAEEWEHADLALPSGTLGQNADDDR